MPIAVITALVLIATPAPLYAQTVEPDELLQAMCAAADTCARTIRLDAARSRHEQGSARGIRGNSGQGAEPARRLGRCG